MASEVHDEHEEPVAVRTPLVERVQSSLSVGSLTCACSCYGWDQEELLLLTERLEEEDTTRSLLRLDFSAEREKLCYADIVGGDDEVCDEEDVDGLESPQPGWNTARSSSATLMEERAQHIPTSSRPKLQPSESLRRRKVANTKEQSLLRKLSQYKKLNAELHHQLQVFYKNEAVAQVCFLLCCLTTAAHLQCVDVVANCVHCYRLCECS